MDPNLDYNDNQDELMFELNKDIPVYIKISDIDIKEVLEKHSTDFSELLKKSKQIDILLNLLTTTNSSKLYNNFNKFKEIFELEKIVNPYKIAYEYKYGNKQNKTKQNKGINKKISKKFNKMRKPQRISSTSIHIQNTVISNKKYPRHILFKK